MKQEERGQQNRSVLIKSLLSPRKGEEEKKILLWLTLRREGGVKGEQTDGRKRERGEGRGVVFFSSPLLLLLLLSDGCACIRRWVWGEGWDEMGWDVRGGGWCHTSISFLPLRFLLPSTMRYLRT